MKKNLLEILKQQTYFLTPDQYISVYLTSSHSANLTVNVGYEFIDPKYPDEKKTGFLQITLPAGLGAEKYIFIGGTYLIGISAEVEGFFQWGSVFCQAQVRTGTEAGDNRPVFMLFQGDIRTNSALSFPMIHDTNDTAKEGLLIVNPGNPSAGAELSYSFPTYVFGRLVSFSCTLATDANAASRRMSVAIQQVGPLTVQRARTNVTQAANLTYNYHFQSEFPIRDNSVATQVIEPLPLILLNNNFIIATSIENKQVGDQLSNIRLIYTKKIINSA